MEEWRDIPWADEYQVSNTGKVKKKGHIGYRGHVIEDHILKAHENSNGYLRISINGKRYFIHRLVAEMFIENKYDKPCVNHIDNNPLNNNIDNLEWCTHKENMEHAQRQGRMKATEKRIELLKAHSKKTPIYAVNLKTGRIEHYASIKEAARKLNGSAGNICDSLKTDNHNYLGRKFHYEHQRRV